jgi:hypothetical protein
VPRKALQNLGFREFPALRWGLREARRLLLGAGRKAIYFFNFSLFAFSPHRAIIGPIGPGVSSFTGFTLYPKA